MDALVLILVLDLIPTLFDAGGKVGPDLTGAARRFNTRDLLEAIVEPNRVVSDQYRTSRIALKDGRVLTGKIKDQSGNSRVLITDPLSPADLLQVARDEVDDIAWTGASTMPEGLLNTRSLEEIADLFAYLGQAAEPQVTKGPGPRVGTRNEGRGAKE